MKYIKLFESHYLNNDDMDVNKVCDFYDDVKTIEYIITEDNKDIDIKYCLRFTCIPDSTLQKEIHLVYINSKEVIQTYLIKDKYKLTDFIIVLDNKIPQIPGPGSYQKILKEFYNITDYYQMCLMDHLDYINPNELSEERYSRSRYIKFNRNIFLK